MKNLKIFLLTICCFVNFGFQEQKTKMKNPSPESIAELLDSAENSIDMMEFDKAQAQLNEAIEISNKIGHKRYIALSSSILARMYHIRHEFEKAASQLQRAIDIQQEINDDEGLAYSYVLNSKILNSKRQYDKALEFLNLAEDFYKSTNNVQQLGIVSLNRGIIQLNKPETKKAAIQQLNEAKALLLNSENTNNYEISRLYYYSARANIFNNNLEEAEVNAEKALEVAEKHHIIGMRMYSYGILSEISEKRDNPEKALMYLKQRDEVNDQVMDKNEEALAKAANENFGLESLKSTVDELTLQNAEQEKNLKVNKLTTILSVALITILSLLTLSLYKNNNLRARANELLQKKNSELTVAKENAEKASMAKAQFLSTITHELRTPLYAVTGLTHLLLEESPTPSQKEHLNSLKFSGEYLLSLINNILDLNKLEANKVEIVESTFDLKKRISDVLIALKNSADERNTKLHLNFDKRISEKLIGDPLKISQILINLLGNSIKFTENGNIWISVTKMNQDKKNVYLQFEVKDDGEGISKEKQKTIFENFTQGSTQINRKFGGTGLGLSIVKNLLMLLHSEIHLESDLGIGSKFSFELKFITPDVQEIAESEVPEPVLDESKLTNDMMRNKHILVVEDNKINQMITRKILEKNDVICDVADNGTIAIEKVQNNHFDLILMDIHMPGISGIEATVEIRKFNQDIPVIALTAVTLDENLDEFYLNGFNDIIPKPYKTEEFFHKINKYLALREATV